VQYIAVQFCASMLSRAARVIVKKHEAEVAQYSAVQCSAV
jgi:hypothetical protein